MLVKNILPQLSLLLMELKWRVVGPLQTNCYLISCGERSVIVDPGGELEEVLPLLEGMKLDAIISTHGHFDHVMAAAALKEVTGAKYMIHGEDVPFVKDLAEWTQKFLNKRIEPPEVDEVLGEELRVGQESLKVLWTPGHTMGSVCLMGVDFLITGDTLFRGTIGRTDLGGSMEYMRRSLALLSSLPDLTVYPGHGPHTTLDRERRSNPFLLDILT